LRLGFRRNFLSVSSSLIGLETKLGWRYRQKISSES